MPAPLPFDRLLRQAATHYRQFYPGEDARLGRGLELALNQQAILLGLASASVRSATDAEIYYHVQGTTCDCRDFQKAPGGRCKHRWSVALTRIALVLQDLCDHEKETEIPSDICGTTQPEQTATRRRR